MGSQWAKCPEGKSQLRLRAGRSSGALSGIEITCSCGAHKTMAGAFNEQCTYKNWIYLFW